MIQKRITIVGSAQPFSSKWWCKGAILKIRFPVSLKDATWTITETASNTNSPPTIAKTSSCLTITETVPSGWQLDDATCTGGSNSGTLTGETLSVTLGAGEDMTCTFTNTVQPANAGPSVTRPFESAVLCVVVMARSLPVVVYDRSGIVVQWEIPTFPLLLLDDT